MATGVKNHDRTYQLITDYPPTHTHVVRFNVRVQLLIGSIAQCPTVILIWYLYMFCQFGLC